MITFKLKGRTLLKEGILSPNLPFAEFDKGLSLKAINNILYALNYGAKLLELLEENRNNVNVFTIGDMFDTMLEIYEEYDYKLHQRRVDSE